MHLHMSTDPAVLSLHHIRMLTGQGQDHLRSMDLRQVTHHLPGRLRHRLQTLEPDQLLPPEYAGMSRMLSIPPR